MTAPTPQSLTLPQGLAAVDATALAQLVAEITGQQDAARDLPWLAPALLFADPGVQDRLAMPRPVAGEAVVHDYQAVQIKADLPTDTPLTATLTPEIQDNSARYRFALAPVGSGDCVTLDTALRLVPARDLSAAQPARFRAEALTGAAHGTPLTVSQSQVDRYLALSGDANPIHRKDGPALALGLAAPVVPGLLLASLIQPICRATLPGHRLRDLKARFLAPVCVGQILRISVQTRASDRLRAYLLAEGERAVAICDSVSVEGR